ncbi:hypothetical protein GDO86_019455 [Hymenochirus boettgeri]|uniref:Uncharacterized protein n=1 Tax=Hymenochirus boettgeri TaxID=247094 RepID=A0A8T2IDM0_9PIPI|nr:hypothetical protein GDO86_019455 [Hymenochirus boettgeri]
MRLKGAQRLSYRRRRQEAGAPLPSRADSTVSKRRIEEEDGGPAMKLFLSEDAVSARLQRLTLDNDHNYGTSGFPKASTDGGPLFWKTGSSEEDLKLEETDEETVILDSGEFCMSSSKVLSVCPLLEETLRHNQPGNILPERLLHSLSSPCMELMVWAPPSHHIQKLLRSLAGDLDPPIDRLYTKELTKDQEDQMDL